MSINVSIITATYNSAATIRDTMRSVSEQDYPFIEHIIVDGYSQDGTLDIVNSFSHTALVLCEKDEGIYDALNKGIKAARGDVIGMLHSDDFYTHPGVIAKVVEAFQDESVQACYADLQYVQAQHPEKITRTWKSGHFQPRSFYWGWMPPHPTFFVRRAVYDQVGLFNTNMRTAADYEMMLRVLLKHHLAAHYIPEVLVKMRAGGASNASVKNRIRANREDREAWKLNGLKPWFFTLYLKPLRKINQFILK
ncbi:MAG TPA: glycosyltransferase family 2 protein [Puia sp.]|nr:glycosyltransferase family 2 protein [Puia sp.]